MFVAKIPNRKSPPTYLLREGFREGDKVKTRTLANITHWPEHQRESLRQLLAGDRLVPLTEALQIRRSLPHGHVHAVLGTIARLGLDRLIDAHPSRERQLVLGMIAQRILAPGSKLATSRRWHNSTLAQQLGIDDAEPSELYAAMDWLFKRQGRIEKRLAEKHLRDGTLVLYDISSSYYEGHCCPLAKFGYNRDGKKGKPIIVYGLLTDKEGCPVAIEAFEGNTADPTTVPAQIEKLRERFGLRRVIVVGDRGMITTTQIEKLKEHPGLGWISAVRGASIRKMIDDGYINRSLFDERNLAEIESPEFPGERLVACHNPLLEDRRQRKREELLQATEKGLARLKSQIAVRKSPIAAEQIALRAGRIVDRHKMAKHFQLTIENNRFDYSRDEASIRREAELDGVYVIRTSEPGETMPADDAVRNYKRLTEVERAFRSLKTIDLEIRPIYHRVSDRVRAHIFLCMLSHYVLWHMRESLSPLLYMDESRREDRLTRDPVLRAEGSEAAKRKKRTHMTEEGERLHDFSTLMQSLSTLCRNECEILLPDGGRQAISLFTTSTPLQRHAFGLLGLSVS
jgi:transposase